MKPNTPATAFEKKHDDGGHVVGLENLHVLITQEGSYWVAQSLEIDYLAQGDSIADVKTAFECGLAVTLAEHLKQNGSIKEILSPAPAEEWAKYFEASKEACHTYSHVHEFKDDSPLLDLKDLFQGIKYSEPQAIAA